MYRTYLSFLSFPFLFCFADHKDAGPAPGGRRGRHAAEYAEHGPQQWIPGVVLRDAHHAHPDRCVAHNEK